MSDASMASVKENDSPGSPFTARGFPVPLGPAAAVSGADGVQVWVIVSGLNWKMMMLGKGTRNVGMNSTNAPLRYLPGIECSLFPLGRLIRPSYDLCLPSLWPHQVVRCNCRTTSAVIIFESVSTGVSGAAATFSSRLAISRGFQSGEAVLPNC